jgi:hypothetical protein
VKSTFIFRRSLNKLVINKKLKTMGNLNQKPILYIRNQNENYFKIDNSKAKECTEPEGLADNVEIIKTNELETSIKVNPFTENPDKVWEQIEPKIIKNQIEPLKLDEPIYDNKVFKLYFWHIQ